MVLSQDPVSLSWFGVDVRLAPDQVAGLRRMMTAIREYRP